MYWWGRLVVYTAIAAAAAGVFVQFRDVPLNQYTAEISKVEDTLDSYLAVPAFMVCVVSAVAMFLSYYKRESGVIGFFIVVAGAHIIAHQTIYDKATATFPHGFGSYWKLLYVTVPLIFVAARVDHTWFKKVAPHRYTLFLMLTASAVSIAFSAFVPAVAVGLKDVEALVHDLAIDVVYVANALAIMEVLWTICYAGTKFCPKSPHKCKYVEQHRPMPASPPHVQKYLNRINDHCHEVYHRYADE
eukprot:Colp12_sorted_trinity150504_noHs@28051